MMERNENEEGVWRLIKFEEIGTWCYTRKVGGGYDVTSKKKEDEM